MRLVMKAEVANRLWALISYERGAMEAAETIKNRAYHAARISAFEDALAMLTAMPDVRQETWG